MRKHKAIRVVFVVSAVLIVALVLTLTKLNAPPDILAKLQFQYQDFEIISSTFQNYESKKSSASILNGKILLQVVENVSNESTAGIILELDSQVTQVGEKLIYFDPYKGETVEYSIPKEFEPIEEKTSIKGSSLKYHIVYANEIFSYFIFSKEKASFKGIVSVFSCDKNVYKIEIFSTINSFDKEKSLNILKEFYCF
jgi:hypothetical protein